MRRRTNGLQGANANVPDAGLHGPVDDVLQFRPDDGNVPNPYANEPNLYGDAPNDLRNAPSPYERKTPRLLKRDVIR